MALQITSMADIFIIILVFLLKSFSSGAVSITPSQGLELAEAFTDKEQMAALSMEISETAIQVDSSPVTPLKNFRFVTKDLDENGLSNTLEVAMKRMRERQNLISKANSEVDADGKILIIADARTPYRTIKSALSSAAIHGYSDFKLVVRKKE